MTEFQMSDHILSNECAELAAEIFAEISDDMSDDETHDDYRDAMSDRAHETVDGHEWVIYHYKARTICARCNVDEGEQFLEDTGMPDDVTFDKLASIIVYGEMLARVNAEIDRLVDDAETEAAA